MGLSTGCLFGSGVYTAKHELLGKSPKPSRVRELLALPCQCDPIPLLHCSQGAAFVEGEENLQALYAEAGRLACSLQLGTIHEGAVAINLCSIF